MKKEKKKILILVEQKNHLMGCVLMSFSIHRMPSNAEKLLMYMVENATGPKYLNSYGSPFKAKRKIGFTDWQYEQAFKELTKFKAIIKKGHSASGYYRFNKTLIKLLKLK